MLEVFDEFGLTQTRSQYDVLLIFVKHVHV